MVDDAGAPGGVMTLPVLEADSVSKDFREGRGDVVSVLNGVSRSLSRGEIVTLAGA